MILGSKFARATVVIYNFQILWVLLGDARRTAKQNNSGGVCVVYNMVD